MPREESGAQSRLDENNILEDVEVDRVDIVDYPCVQKAKFLIIKRKGGLEMPADDTKLGEEIEKSLADAAKMIEEEMGKVKDEKKKKRLNLILANLKGLVSKTDGEEEEDDKKKEMEKSLIDELKLELQSELKEEIDKAGKKISKETASEIEKISDTLKKVCEDLDGLLKAGPMKPEYEKPYGDYGKKPGYPKPMKKDIASSLRDVFALYKNGTMTDKELDAVVDKFSEIALQEDSAEK